MSVHMSRSVCVCVFVDKNHTERKERNIIKE